MSAKCSSIMNVRFGSAQVVMSGVSATCVLNRLSRSK